MPPTPIATCHCLCTTQIGAQCAAGTSPHHHHHHKVVGFFDAMLQYQVGGLPWLDGPMQCSAATVKHAACRSQPACHCSNSCTRTLRSQASTAVDSIWPSAVCPHLQVVLPVVVHGQALSCTLAWVTEQQQRQCGRRRGSTVTAQTSACSVQCAWQARPPPHMKLIMGC
jgi:hypothetical protein